jgi:hypothetical protein
METTHSGDSKSHGSAPARRLWTVITICCVLTFVGNVAVVRAQESDKRIEETRRLYKQVNEQIATSEKEKPYSGIFCDELVLNRNDNPWPAVGIYKSVVKAFYTFSHEEGEPYPNRLLQITVSTKRSARSEYAEYLFNPAGQLVFCFEKNDGDPTAELRYYFANGRAIRITRDQKTIQLSNAELRAAQDAMKEGLKFKRIFLLGQS